MSQEFHNTILATSSLKASINKTQLILYSLLSGSSLLWLSSRTSSIRPLLLYCHSFTLETSKLMKISTTTSIQLTIRTDNGQSKRSKTLETILNFMFLRMKHLEDSKRAKRVKKSLMVLTAMTFLQMNSTSMTSNTTLPHFLTDKLTSRMTMKMTAMMMLKVTSSRLFLTLPSWTKNKQRTSHLTRQHSLS